MKKHILFLIILALNTLIASATHLLGGNISYKHVSSSNGKSTYNVTVSLYRDCKNSDVVFDEIIKIGIYHDNVLKSIFRRESFTISRRVPFPVPCYSNLPICVELGIYEKTITLDSTDLGFYLSYIRCCRARLKNVKNDASGTPNNGFTILSYIPTSNYRNTSPEFATHPFPFHGVNIQSTDYLGAFDQDGDSLVYKIVAPYQGGAPTGSGSEPDPAAIMENSAPVNYVSGYSANDPLGNTGNVTIDSSNGMLFLKNSIAESYAFCIEIEEFRAGKLIGIHRRDYPLLFINLPPSSNPVKISLAKASVYGGNKVQLNWNICPRSFPEYTIERSDKSTGWSEIKKRETNNFYNDSIDYDNWYYYRIKAIVNNVTIISNIDTVFASSIKLGNAKQLKQKTHLYPNPADNYLIFDNLNTFSYLIYDINGRLLKDYSNKTTPVSKIDIKDLNPGLYMIFIETENGWIKEKFVKLSIH